jgi:hypothetical protein
MSSHFNKFCLILASALASVSTVQAAPVDDYKSFGSVAAVSEMCLNSSQITDRINVVVPAAVKKNPEITGIMQSLIEAYNAAYSKAIVDARIWEPNNSGNFSYSKPINCRNADDLNKVKYYHSAILKAL